MLPEALYDPQVLVLIWRLLFETVPHDDWRFPVQLHFVTMVEVFPLTTVVLAQAQVARGTEGGQDGVTESMYC